MIVIRCNACISDEDFLLLRRYLVEQAAEGLILLPEFCTLEAVTQQDSEIVIRQGGKKKPTPDCSTCTHRIWGDPECSECNADNGFRYYSKE